MKTIGTALMILLGSVAEASPICGRGDEACWRRELKTLCSYDPYCTRLTEPDTGAWKEPAPEVKESIRGLAPAIRETAARYGVDPLALAGALLTENSLNVTNVDALQDFLVRYRLLPDGRVPFIDRPVSFGFGQVQLDRAVYVEPRVARVERRTPGSRREVALALLVPRKAIAYVAALIQDAQEVYSEQGFPEVRTRIDLQTTLFNIGNPRRHSADARALGRPPRTNYFGFFVMRNLPELRTILQPDQETPQEDVRTASAPRWIARKPLELVNTPPLCSVPVGASGRVAEYHRFNSYFSPKPAGTLRADAPFEILAPGISCLRGGLEPWSLIRAEDGVVGWIPDGKLRNEKSQAGAAPNCRRSPARSCESQVRAIVGSRLIDPATGGDWPVRLSVSRPGADPDWRRSGLGCGEDSSDGSSSMDADPDLYYFGPDGGVPGTPLKEARLREIVAAIDGFRRRVAETLDLSEADFDSARNPYALIAGKKSDLAVMRRELESCLPRAGAKAKKRCYLENPSSLIAALRGEVARNPSYRRWRDLSDRASATFAVSRVAPKPDLAARRARIRDAALAKLAGCREIKGSSQAVASARDTLFARIRDPENSIITGDLESDLDQLARSCDWFSRLSAGHGAIAGVGASDDPETLGIGRTEATLGHLAAILRTQGDLDQFLLERFQQVEARWNASRAGSAPVPEARCGTYDPIATAEKIEALLRIRCVRAVYVPDPWLVRRFGDASARVFYRPMIERDRYRVELTGASCK